MQKYKKCVNNGSERKLYSIICSRQNSKTQKMSDIIYGRSLVCSTLLVAHVSYLPYTCRYNPRLFFNEVLSRNLQLYCSWYSRGFCNQWQITSYIIIFIFFFIFFFFFASDTYQLRVLTVLKARNKGTNYLTLKIERVLFFCLEARNSLQGLCLIRPQPSFKVFDVYD